MKQHEAFEQARQGKRNDRKEGTNSGWIRWRSWKICPEPKCHHLANLVHLELFIDSLPLTGTTVASSHKHYGQSLARSTATEYEDDESLCINDLFATIVSQSPTSSKQQEPSIPSPNLIASQISKCLIFVENDASYTSTT
jgi:hypothetical protein